MAEETRGTVLLALTANVGVGVAKAVGGVVTGSSALLAEAAHSVADTLNEAFLLLSLSRADRPADRTHPFGYGKERFFWSLLAAVGIFLSGAVFSVAEGVSALRGGADPPAPRTSPSSASRSCSRGRRCSRHCGRSSARPRPPAGVC